MSVSFKKFFKLLIDRNMSQVEFRIKAGIAPNTMTKLRRDEPVTFAILDRMCKMLEVDYGDIMEYKPDVKDDENK
ncbi:MAG TPA: helix-turn-helix transcriptional regulator [Fervidobacterium sp.]|nr:helix-turn-helix transcriptional regulator [Fervidobacterium sp.]